MSVNEYIPYRLGDEVETPVFIEQQCELKRPPIGQTFFPTDTFEDGPVGRSTGDMDEQYGTRPQQTPGFSPSSGDQQHTTDPQQQRVPETDETPLLDEITSLLGEHMGENVYLHLDGKQAMQDGTYGAWIDRMTDKRFREHTNILVQVAERRLQNAGYAVLGERVNRHLARLLSPDRTQIEQQFACTFIDHSPILYRQIQTDIALSGKLNTVIGEENENVPFWWSISPYLYDIFSHDQVPPRDAIRYLMNWATKADKKNNQQMLTLPGTKDIPWYDRTRFVLSPGGAGNDWTHTTAQLIATYLQKNVRTHITPIR